MRFVPDVTLWMKDQTLRGELILDPVLNWSWVFQKSPAQIWYRETSLGPKQLMEELLNCKVLWSQYSQVMTVMLC